MTEFVRASRLYDVEASEVVAWDWAAIRPVTERRATAETTLGGEP